MYWRIYTAYQLIAFFGFIFAGVHWLQVRRRLSGWLSLYFLALFLLLVWTPLTMRLLGGLSGYFLPVNPPGLAVSTLLLLAPWAYYGWSYLQGRPARPARRR